MALAEASVQGASHGATKTIYSGKVPLTVNSCCGLPPIMGTTYAPDVCTLVDLPKGNAKALIVVSLLLLVQTGLTAYDPFEFL